jgi:hypothetical protein
MIRFKIQNGLENVHFESRYKNIEELDALRLELLEIQEVMFKRYKETNNALYLEFLEYLGKIEIL